MDKTLRLYDAALGRTAALILVVDRDGVVQFFNQACTDLTGFALQDVVGRPFWEKLVPDEQRAGVIEVTRQLSAGDFPNEHENDWLTASGERVPIKWHNTVTLGDDGAIEYLVGTGIPVADLRAAERAAEAERQRLQAFVSALPDIFFVIDDAGRYLDVHAPNPALLAAPPSELLGATIFDFLPPAFCDQIVEASRRARQSGQPQELRYSLDVVAGERFFLARLSATGDGNTLIIVRDVTEVEHARVEAERARDAAQSASRAKSTFLATMSHEIRTPLNGVLGFAHLLLDEGALTDEQTNHVQTIADSGRRLLDLLNDVLDLAKIEAGRITVRDDDVDLEALCAEAIDAFAAQAARKGIRLELSVDPRLPRRGVVDGRRLGQVFTNLLSNAVKFTERGFVRLRALQVGGGESAQLRISVEDSGIGLAPADQARVFEPFEQGDTDELNRRYEGTGLGLPISQQLTELMGGTLTVESTPGEGSTFTVELPLRLPDAARSVRAAPTPPASGSLLDASVLILDDTQTNRRLYGSLLSRWGADVALVESGRNALVQLAERTFDLILLDLNMPGLSGVETARLIRKDARHDETPLLLVSSVDFLTSTELSVFDETLIKPVRPETLFSTIQRLLPDRTGEMPPAPRPAAAPAGLGEPPRGSILIVEDEQMNARLLQRMLERVGFETEIAVDGEKALERLRMPDAPFDAILLDVMMPRMDGLAMMRALEAELPDHPPVVVVSARAFDQQRQEMLDAGADVYVTKPVYRDELFDALTRVLPARTYALPTRSGTDGT